MASRRRFAVSRSVALSLAALLVLTGAMFMVTTFQADSEEWVLVEDEVIADAGVFSTVAALAAETDSPEFTFVFDEGTSTYTLDITGGNKAATNVYQSCYFALADGFDFSKNYKLSFVSSDCGVNEFFFIENAVSQLVFNLKSIQSADDGSYSGSVVMLDQLMTDLSYKDSFAFGIASSSSATFIPNTFTIQVYELQTDNTGSIAAGVTGLVLIVMGVFAMPMHNILRRR